MFKFLGINLQSFTNTSEIIEKGENTDEKYAKKIAALKERRDPEGIETDENIEKGGPGSGRRSNNTPKNSSELGKTKSGKTIYEDGSELEGDDDWSAEDHEEAATSHKDSKYAEKHKEKSSSKKYISKSEGSDSLIGTVGQEELQKSHINWNFGRNENLPIAKKGADIKEKLLKIKEHELLECQSYQSKLEALKVSINSEPTECIDEYTTEGLDITILPKVYAWSETYSENEQDILCKQKREYNEAARNYVKSQSEIILIDTMVNNLDDAKMYQLTVQQAAILKF